jgi:exopolyphosphatase / guanosine-5'-triphosphate,3'-diphosphate pyrophosphatase
MADKGDANHNIVAGVDLGSNSFHMVVARHEGGHVSLIDKHRERVRLAAGLGENKRLSKEARKRALACLERFGERLRGIPPEKVRVVGTNTLRKASNGKAFLARAEEALGHRIEIVSGREEARLVYLGVFQTTNDEGGRRLVVDIGGGSTELIIGEGIDTEIRDSLFMGCVGYTGAHFTEDKITQDAWETAELSARLELQAIKRQYRDKGWDRCYGSSGTVHAVAEILRENGWGKGEITQKGIKKLRNTILDAGQVSPKDIPGLSPDRAPVLIGGLAILSAIFKSLRIEEMVPAKGALREGLLFDLLGRLSHEDVRQRSVDNVALRYGVDQSQAHRVAETALYLFDQVAKNWQLKKSKGREFLAWAAQVHEVGLSVSFTGYHRHSAYLLANNDMPGFSRSGQSLLALLVEAHRRKFPKAKLRETFPEEIDFVSRICVLFRLAVLFHRSRSPNPLPQLDVSAKGDELSVAIDANWLEAHPLTHLDLERERNNFDSLGLSLRF